MYLGKLMGLKGKREIKRLTDEILIKVRRILEGDGVSLVE